MVHQYESLSYMARLEFKDPYGVEALFHCYQRLRIIAPEVNSVVHHMWGDGDQLNDYAAPGTHVRGIFGEDGRRRVISSLDAPARSGDIIELHSIRRIHHGFKGDRQYWEFSPYTPTTAARVAISFPLAREPERISVGTSAGTSAPIVSRPATKELILKAHFPDLNSLYRIEWSW